MQFTHPGRRGDRGGLSETGCLLRAKIAFGLSAAGCCTANLSASHWSLITIYAFVILSLSKKAPKFYAKTKLEYFPEQIWRTQRKYRRQILV